MCAIVQTLVCTKTHLGVLLNTPVFIIRENYTGYREYGTRAGRSNRLPYRRRRYRIIVGNLLFTSMQGQGLQVISMR